MSKLSTFFAGTALTLTATVCAATLLAQQPQQAEQPRREAQQQGAQTGVVTAEDMATWLILDNLAEIQLSQLALERAQSDQVRQFAQMMIEDHLAAVNKIQQTGYGQHLRDRVQQRAANGQAQQQQVRAQQQEVQQQQEAQQQQPQQEAQQQQQAGQQPRQVTLTELKKELSDKHVEKVLEQMRQKEGRDFDIAYMHAQVLIHHGMLTTLETFQQYAPQDLAGLIREEIPSVEQHLQRAENTLRQLTPERAAQQPQPGVQR